MRDTPRPNDDHKDMMIGGCRVRLTYNQAAGSGWTVNAAIRCGLGDHADERSLVTKAFESREAAEHDALQQVTALLGENTDRSHSRVRNWS
jgi:hypothetical protein